ncbi:MAG: hypothetical protein SGBAC_001787 [Bacillariaceae sp.]
MRRGSKNKNKGIAATLKRYNHCPPSPQRWYQLLDEHDQCMQEVEDAFQSWLNRHQEAVQESKRWKEAHEKTAQELNLTRMELASTKKRLNILQEQVSSPRNSSNKSIQGNEKRCPTDAPSVVRSYDDEHSLERDASDVSRWEHGNAGDDFPTADRNRQMLKELKFNMESYQVILRWQERQTDQWRSRCNGKLSQIEGLLATVEQQRIELQQEKEQCDVLIDAVYDLVHQQRTDSPVVLDENTRVENSTQQDLSSIPAYPDDCCCPLTQQLFVDPVIDYEGNTFEKEAILEWLEEYNQTSPITRSPLTKDQLIPNRAVKHAIAAWDKR